MNDQRIREILEPQAPRLSGETAQRIEARISERMEQGAGGFSRQWLRVAAPVLLVLLALFWLLPRGGGEPGYLLVNEEQFAEYLGEWESGGGDLSELLEIDYELDDGNWSREEREALLDELDNFSLDTI